MSVDWAVLVERALDKASTPFYLCASEPVQEALAELDVLEGVLPIRHWLSLKTHPVAPLLRKWKEWGFGIEVVSEYELLAALHEGFSPDAIVVNGVAKHSWLTRHELAGLFVHFDSLAEIEVLAGEARNQTWHVGLRCHLSMERDQDEPEFGGQFGLDANEVITAADVLRENKLRVDGVHFHLGTNLPDVEIHGRALCELLNVCKAAGIEPGYIDLGGGFPVPNEPVPGNRQVRRQLNLHPLISRFEKARDALGDHLEIWLENGRFLTARSAVLVIQVRDVKQRSDSRYLICDGGRTNHALVSDWETHDILILPHRTADRIHTTICGPSCMAYDRLDRLYLPSDIQVGDYIVWMNAGAYHIPWETRFSRGVAPVLWHGDDGDLTIVRESECFDDWWGQWK